MENQAKKSTGSGNDRLSELPDEILHSILRRLDSPNQAAQTAALSTRWRSLWLSYPVAEFDCCGDSAKERLEKFCIATVQRISRDELMRIDSLKVSAGKYKYYKLNSRLFEQLVDLASQRKAAEIVLKRIDPPPLLHLCSLSNSCAKVLILENIYFRNDDRPLSLNSLRFLHLNDVTFHYGQLFENLIASCPLLETLELESISTRSDKLRVSNHANLKMLAICGCVGLKEIEIAAPRLEILRIKSIVEGKLKIDLTAPQLSVLDIDVEKLDMDYLNAVVISRLQQLKSLTIAGGYLVGRKKLKFSIPNLEEFNLRTMVPLEEIELDFGPHMRIFSLSYIDSGHGLKKCEIDGLKKCEIDNASADCRWEVDYCAYDVTCGTAELFVRFKSFITRFPQFDTVTVRSINYSFRNPELDWSVLPKAIKHLKIAASWFLEAEQVAALCHGLFWACRPTFLTIICKNLFNDRCPKLLSHFLYALNLNKQGFDERCSWQHRLKNVQIVTKGVHPDVEDEETLKGLMTVPEDLIKMHDARDQVCFKLTWL